MAGHLLRPYNTYMYTDDGYLVVWTNGACIDNGKPTAKAGYGVYFYDGCRRNYSSKLWNPQTNNHAELAACIQALHQVEAMGYGKVEVRTDSQFVINCITVWFKEWKRNGWKTATGTQAIDQEEFEELDELCNEINALGHVRFKYVEGHGTDEGNIIADQMARKGAELVWPGLQIQ